METLLSLLLSAVYLLGVQLTLQTLLLGGAGLLLRTHFARRRRVYRLPFDAGQLRRELLAGVFVVTFDPVMMAVREAGEPVRFGEVTLVSSMVTFAVFFVVNEAWFYASHRALHSPWLYFLHAQHHTARVTSPLSTVSFSLAEHVLTLLPVMLVGLWLHRFMPLSPVGLGAFLLVNTAGNLLGHLNVELFPPGFARTPLGQVLFSSTFHAQHHARYRGHYGLYTRVLDRLCGTEFADYPALQTAAAEGRGLDSLGAHLPVEPAAASRSSRPTPPGTAMPATGGGAL